MCYFQLANGYAGVAAQQSRCRHVIFSPSHTRYIDTILKLMMSDNVLAQSRISHLSRHFLFLFNNSRPHPRKIFAWVSYTQEEGGTLVFSSYVGSGPASTVHPKKISGISSTPKIFEILATPKNIQILYPDLKEGPKMHRNDPQTSQIL